MGVKKTIIREALPPGLMALCKMHFTGWELRFTVSINPFVLIK
jgi:hypothetical protein